MSGFVLKIRGNPTGNREYVCPSHGPFELVVDLATSSTPRPCPTCAAPSERTLEANIVARAGYCGFHRGKADPAPPYATTTEALADGMPIGEWKKERRSLWRDADRKEAKTRGLL